MKTLHMVFLMEGKKELTVSMTDPKNGLTKAETDAVMQLCITKKAIMKNGVSPTGIKSSFIREVTESPLE